MFSHFSPVSFFPNAQHPVKYATMLIILKTQFITTWFLWVVTASYVSAGHDHVVVVGCVNDCMCVFVEERGNFFMVKVV